MILGANIWSAFVLTFVGFSLFLLSPPFFDIIVLLLISAVTPHLSKRLILSPHSS